MPLHAQLASHFESHSVNNLRGQPSDPMPVILHHGHFDLAPPYAARRLGAIKHRYIDLKNV